MTSIVKVVLINGPARQLVVTNSMLKIKEGFNPSFITPNGKCWRDPWFPS